MNTIKSDSKKNKILLNVAPYAIFEIVILIILSYQIRTHTAIFVSDGYFHFSRFYDAAQQIKTNNYSFFQSNWGFNQSGRIINALYGPFFAYLMGFILLICGTWFKFQIVTSFLISLVAAIGIYECLKYVSSNNIANILISLIQTRYRKEMMLNLGLAILATILLTTNVWIMLLYFNKIDIVSNPGAFNMYKATLFWHYFTLISICLMLFQFMYVAFHWKQSRP